MNKANNYNKNLRFMSDKYMTIFQNRKHFINIFFSFSHNYL